MAAMDKIVVQNSEGQYLAESAGSFYFFTDSLGRALFWDPEGLPDTPAELLAWAQDLGGHPVVVVLEEP